MRYIKTSELKNNMIIGKNVYDKSGVTLASAGTVINDIKIKQLISNGITSICIQDELTKDINLEETVSQELENKIIKDLNNMDFFAIINDAHKLIYEFETAGELVYNPYKWIGQKDEQSHAVFITELIIMLAMSIKKKDGTRIISGGNMHELVVASLLQNIGYLARNPEVMQTLDDVLIFDEKMVPKYSYDLLPEISPISNNTKKAIRFQNKNADESDLEENYKEAGIGVYAKIIRIAKTYEKLITTPTLGMEPLSPTEAIARLKQQAGTMYDENILNLFTLLVPIYSKGMTVRLNDGRVGVISKTSLSNDMDNQKLLISIRLSNGENINISSKHNVKIEDYCILPEEIYEEEKERKVG